MRRAARILLATLLGLAATPAGAAVFVVDDPTDAVDLFPGDGACATALGTCTLRAAILESNALLGPDEITLPAGTYALAIPGAGEDAGLTGDLDVLDELAIRGDGMDLTVIDGAGIDRVLDVFAPPLDLSDLSIRHGAAPMGAGVRAGALGGEPSSFDRVAIESNAGVGIDLVEFNLDFRDGRISGNSSSGIVQSGSLVIERSEIVGNGGGVLACCEWFGGVLAHSVHVADNGGFAFSIAETGVDLVDSLVERNGGGISAGSDTFSRVQGSVIRDHEGPAVEMSCGSHCITLVESSTISGNEGGGFLLGYEARVTIERSTISGNSATRGGGISIHGPAAQVRLFDSTVTGNTASTGGGLSVDGWDFSPQVTLRNAVVAANTAATDPDCHDTSTVPFEPVSLGHNLIGDVGSCTIAAAPGDQIGDSGAPIDPMLGPLADHGGTTPTHAPLPGSPAVDAGSCLLTEPADQRGLPRWRDGDGDGPAGCDVGAVEVQPCDDGVDNDGDGLADLADPGCLAPFSTSEHAGCQDGTDDDGDGAVDFDGGASRNGGVALAAADPECAGRAWATERSAGACGLGGEAALLGLLAARLRRRRPSGRATR